MKIKIAKSSFGEGVYGQVLTARSGDETYAFKRFTNGLDESAIREIGVCALLKKVAPDQIARVKGFKIKRGHIGVLMEKATTNLWQWTQDYDIRERKRNFPDIVDRCMKSLGALHVCDIVHGDIKSENILVWVEGETVTKCVLADFGLSSSYPDQKHDSIYTPNYRPPETWLEDKAVKASDVWALGVTFVDCILDTLIFYNYTVDMYVKDKIVPYIERKRDRVYAFTGEKHGKKIMKMLEWEPENRLKMPVVEVDILERRWKEDDQSLRRGLERIQNECKTRALKRHTFCLAADIYLRYFHDRECPSYSDLYGVVALWIATGWGELWPLETSDFDFMPSKLWETKIEMMVALKGVVWIPMDVDKIGQMVNDRLSKNEN